MTIAVLTTSDWSKATKLEECIQGPAWTQVETAIRALNNANINDVYLQPDENDSETYLCVGGGGGRYILTGSIKNEVFPTLVDPARSPLPQIPLVVGGQSGDYPNNWIADLSTALKAAQAFFEKCGFDCGIEWVTV